MKKLVVLLFFPSLCFAQKNHIYKNLVLEGGGVRGLAYAGAFDELEKRGILNNIEQVAGSSAGAIAGLMLSLGYNTKEIDSIMRNLPVEDFNDGRGGIVGKYRRIRNKFGLYEGKKFERWLNELIREKTGLEELTFATLHELRLKNKMYKDFYCTGTNLTKQKLVIFSHHHSPDMLVAVAVRISGSVPLYFEPVVLDDGFQKVNRGDTLSVKNYFIDGGVLANYPINIFDSCGNNGNPLFCEDIHFNPSTLGIKLERPAQIDSLRNNSINIPPFNIRSFKEYIYAFNNLLIETMNRRFPNLENEKGRTIYVSYGSIRSRVRKMKPLEKEMLYNNGVHAVREFLDSH